MAIPVSALDLALVPEGGNYKTAIDRAVAIAQFLETAGYQRIWLAEHHNMPNIASSATSLLIGHIAQQTQKIRVGSGGIMLPNHSTLSVAENFGTLEAMFPGRIDLGLGRAPGTDNRTAMALRGENFRFDYDFEANIRQLQDYFQNESRVAPVRAFPGEGAAIPFYILGSSTDSAHLAAKLGLPYAFAAHFAPRMLEEAAGIYRQEFQAGPQLDKPYFMVCVNAIIAESEEEAAYQATSLFQTFVGVLTNNRKALQPPVESMDGLWNEEIRYHLNNMLSASFIGSKASLEAPLRQFITQLKVDEIIATAALYDQQDRKTAYRLLKEILDDI